jgi:hypothetical protein
MVLMAAAIGTPMTAPSEPSTSALTIAVKPETSAALR